MAPNKVRKLLFIISFTKSPKKITIGGFKLGKNSSLLNKIFFIKLIF